MAVGNITSATAELMLIQPTLFPAGVKLEQFSTDQSFSQADVQVAETRIGIDGQMVAGYIPSIKEVTISLEASSPSFPFMRDLFNATDKGMTIYPVTIVVRIPSITTVITWTNGVLYTGTPVPAGEQILGATTWVFHFNHIIVAGWA